MRRAVLLTGSNSAERYSRLQRAAELVAQRVGQLHCCSGIYTSPPWGFSAATEFCNQAIVVDTALGPQELLEEVLDIERQVGRNRPAEQAEKELTQERYASREIDIDIIFYQNDVISTPSLTVPHPLMAEREFVLRPLCEVMPDFRHPVLGRTMQELLEDVKTKGE